MNKPQRLARRQEQRSSEDYGAKLTPASGSQPGVKGDGYTGTELIEYKHTQGKSFGLRRDELEKLFRQAITAGRRAVWEIEYTDQYGRKPFQVVVLDKDDYLAMKEMAAIYEDLRNS